jgi:6-pyruvoyl-tetrahydropterin synthase
MLPGHPGDCGRHHGHSWEAWITLRGPIQAEGDERGMVLEMGKVAAHFRRILEPLLDHQCLNETIPEEFLPPTTEHVALFILHSYLEAGFPAIKVEVRETENQTAIAYA